VATDDLYAPLGRNRQAARAGWRPLPCPAAAALLGMALATLAIWLAAGRDPLGGEPIAVVKADLRPVEAAARLRPSQPDLAPPESTGAINPAEELVPFKAADRTQEKAPDQFPGRGEQVITIIDGTSGMRREVRIPAPSGPAPSDPAASPTPGPQLAEMTRHGPIPQLGANGMRVSQAYAQPSGTKSGTPQIAIVVTGIGGANAALDKLPPQVTFALAPGGADLERLAEKARSRGHELLLQVPLEASDAAGTHSAKPLVASLPAEQNIDRLHWLMSRFQGYVGVTTAGRLTASEPAFEPILREIGSRGLIYVDDGTSLKNFAGQLLAGAGFARANLVLDTAPSAAEIDKALARLEALARQNGTAIGFATSSPVAVERVLRWSKAVEGRGFSLVPITAAARG
jgi:polysaccharide deacetylase 2 family uncharacterized protein YibQ